MIKNFTDLRTWQRGHQLVLEIYRVTESFPKDEIYALSVQIKRAASSVTSNIAEGFGRKSEKEKIRFYFISQGSLTELQNQLIIARDRNYLGSSSDFEKCWQLAEETAKGLSGLIRSIRSRPSLAASC